MHPIALCLGPMLKKKYLQGISHRLIYLYPLSPTRMHFPLTQVFSTPTWLYSWISCVDYLAWPGLLPTVAKITCFPVFSWPTENFLSTLYPAFSQLLLVNVPLYPCVSLQRSKALKAVCLCQHYPQETLLVWLCKLDLVKLCWWENRGKLWMTSLQSRFML